MDADELSSVNSYFQLDCAVKGLKHLLVGWPDEIGSNHSGNY